MRTCIGLMAVGLAVLLCLGTARAETITVKVKDVVRVKGVNANPLMGYGLVVGLPGTGDSSGSLHTQHAVGNLLRECGIRLDDERVRTRNVAAVMVTATLPAFAQAGDALDVLVSSVGDTNSLRGGTLLMTRLDAADGASWAMAQGPVSTGGEGGGSGGGRAKENAAVGRVPGGALVLRDFSSPLAKSGHMTLVLRDPDYATAERLAQLASAQIGVGGTARALNASVVEIALPPVQVGQESGLLARLGECELSTATVSRIVINERTGTIVMGGDVRIAPVAITHGTMKVRVQDMNVQLAGIVPYGGLQRPAAKPALNVVATQGRLQDLVDALNALGATPTELMQVLQALKQAGALKAELEMQ